MWSKHSQTALQMTVAYVVHLHIWVPSNKKYVEVFVLFCSCMEITGEESVSWSEPVSM